VAGCAAASLVGVEEMVDERGDVGGGGEENTHLISSGRAPVAGDRCLTQSNTRQSHL